MHPDALLKVLKQQIERSFKIDDFKPYDLIEFGDGSKSA